MKFDLVLRIGGCARQCLAALAILAILGLAMPSASASVVLTFTVDGGGSMGLTSGVSAAGSGGVVGGDIAYTITATAEDSTSGSGLTTTTIDIHNSAAATETITFVVTGTGYDMGALAANGFKIEANYSIAGTGGPFNGAKDSVSVSSTVAGTSLGSSAGSIAGTGVLTKAYVFSPSSSPTADITLSTTSFSMTQTLAIKLGSGDKSSMTFITQAAPNPIQSTPEPSSMVLAGIGALGMIGFGLRRRKALGV